MKVVAELRDTEAHGEFRRFLTKVPRKEWKRKLAKLRSLPRFPAPCPNAYVNYLENLNPLTRNIGKFLQVEARGDVIRNHLTPDLMKTCGQLKIINEICDRSSGAVVEKIKSILLDDETINSFLFEVDVAIHFLAQGHDVQFVDLTGSGTFDLLVTDGERQVEIECKTKSADAGRKIARRNFYLLCDVLATELLFRLESFAIIIKCDGHLSGSQDFFYRVAEEIKRCRSLQQATGSVEIVNFEIINLPPGITVRNATEAAGLLAPHLSERGHYFILSGRQTLLIACESTVTNRALRAIYEDLKRGARQLTRTRPSILACQLEDIDDEHWEQLRGETGFAIMTSRLLRSSDRRHVNFAIYSSTNTPPQSIDSSILFSITTLRFQNTNAQYEFPDGFLITRDVRS